MRRFRHLRRCTALVVQLLLLQLTVVSSAGACPVHDSAARGAGMVMSDVMRPHAQHAAPEMNAAAVHHALVPPASAPHASGHCDMSCPSANCEANGHCGSYATITGAATARPATSEQDHASIGMDVVPRSVNSAPEPPPPRG